MSSSGIAVLQRVPDVLLLAVKAMLVAVLSALVNYLSPCLEVLLWHISAGSLVLN